MATDFNPPAPSDTQNLKMEQKNSVNISNDDDLSSFDIQHTDVKEKKRGNNQQFSLDFDSGSNLDPHAIFKEKALNLSNINPSEDDMQILHALPKE